MIYSWDSIESFNTWHEEIKKHYGIPDGITTEYTSPIIVNKNDIRAYVVKDDGSLLPDLIGKESEPYIETSSM